jgi:hypothetical protein
MAETPWLELPYQSLSKENVRAEAARRGLTFRKLMALYYQHDRERGPSTSPFTGASIGTTRKSFSGRPESASSWRI